MPLFDIVDCFLAQVSLCERKAYMQKTQIPEEQRIDMQNMAKRIPALLVTAFFMIGFAFSAFYPGALLLSVVMSFLVSSPSTYTPFRKAMRLFWNVVELLAAGGAIVASVTNWIGPHFVWAVLAYFVTCLLSAVTMIERKTLGVWLFGFAVYVGLTLMAVLGIVHGAIIGEAVVSFLMTGLSAIAIPLGLTTTYAKSPVKDSYHDHIPPQEMEM